MRKLLGIFPLGHENVNLFVEQDSASGSFDTRPDDKSLGEITVGLNYSEWREVVSVTLHETFEYIMCRKFKRYSCSGDLNGDHASYIFVFDHCTFGDMCERQAFFLVPALPILADAFKKARKKKKKCRKG